MYEILKHFHSGWAYLTLLMAVIFVIVSGMYAFKKRDKTKFVKTMSLMTLIAFHIQLLVGVGLYLLSPYSGWDSNTMKVAELRFFALEHPLMMVLSVVLITLAHRSIKKHVKVKKSTFILGLIAFLFLVSRIPWDIWWS